MELHDLAAPIGFEAEDSTAQQHGACCSPYWLVILTIEASELSFHFVGAGFTMQFTLHAVGSIALHQRVERVTWVGCRRDARNKGSRALTWT